MIRNTCYLFPVFSILVPLSNLSIAQVKIELIYASSITKIIIPGVYATMVKSHIL